MGLFQADSVIKTTVQLFLEDLRKNIWLMDYILEDFTRNPYLKDAFGQKQIDSAKEWFKNNNIDVTIGYNSDKLRPPCVSIILEPQQEKTDMKHMADLTPNQVILLPNEIGRPISYVVKVFTPTGYDQSTGEVSIDSSIDLQAVTSGMILVNPTDGVGYIIEEVSANGIKIEAGIDIGASQFGILPQFKFYKARLEHIFMNANYTIVCTAHGDAQTVLWLHDIVLYGLLRYKESLLEALGLSETVISSGSLDVNEEFGQAGGEIAWSRAISISGQIEQTFIKAPHRIIESVVLKKKDKCEYGSGIKIISNLDTPNFMDESQESWTTVDSSDPDENE